MNCLNPKQMCFIKILSIRSPLTLFKNLFRTRSHNNAKNYRFIRNPTENQYKTNIFTNDPLARMDIFSQLN